MKSTAGPWEATPGGIVGKRVRNGSMDLICDLRTSPFIDEIPYNSLLIAAAPDLLDEHKCWAKITGRILVEALQGEFEYLKVVAMNTKINFLDGEPMLKSETLNQAEGRE